MRRRASQEIGERRYMGIIRLIIWCIIRLSRGLLGFWSESCLFPFPANSHILLFEDDKGGERKMVLTLIA